jgi:hypothetical protein
MASRDYASLQSKAQLERETVLQRIVKFLCAEETGDSSFKSLSAALDVPEGSLREEFGAEEKLLEAAGQMLPELVVASVAEPLRTSRTGREAVFGMLEMAVSLRKARRRLRQHGSAVRSLSLEKRADEQTIWDWNQSLSYEIQARFEQSVYEGELPESANVHAMSALTLALVNGLVSCAPEVVSDVALLDAVRLFVDGLGFHVPRPSKRRMRPLAPVLQFVRRSSCGPQQG